MIISANESTPAERRSRSIALTRFRPRSFGVQPSSTTPGGVEVDLVGRHRGAEQADREVGVAAATLPVSACGTKPCPTAPQSGRSLIAATTKHEQAEPAVAEHPLDPLERQDPDRHDEADDGDDDQHAVRTARSSSSTSADAADLGRERHQVDDLGRDQRPGPDREAHPLAHDVEHGALRDRGDPAAHLRVDDDPDHADDDHPEQLVAERRAGLDVEDEVADVDEPADRRQDPERDLEEPCSFRQPLGASSRAAPDRRKRLRRGGGARGRGRRRGDAATLAAPSGRRAACASFVRLLLQVAAWTRTKTRGVTVLATGARAARPRSRANGRTRCSSAATRHTRQQPGTRAAASRPRRRCMEGERRGRPAPLRGEGPSCNFDGRHRKRHMS